MSYKVAIIEFPVHNDCDDNETVVCDHFYISEFKEVSLIELGILRRLFDIGQAPNEHKDELPRNSLFRRKNIKLLVLKDQKIVNEALEAAKKFLQNERINNA